MSEDEIVAAPVGGPSAGAPPAAVANEMAEPVPVESAAGFADIPDAASAIGLPDHLLRYSNLEDAFQAMERRNPRYESLGELLEGHEALRADHSRRLEAWLEGNA